jgi:hypothetical protein
VHNPGWHIKSEVYYHGRVGAEQSEIGNLELVEDPAIDVTGWTGAGVTPRSSRGSHLFRNVPARDLGACSTIAVI